VLVTKIFILALCSIFMREESLWRVLVTIALLVILAGWWYMSPYEPVYSEAGGLAAPAIFIEECRGGEVLRIRQVAGHMVPSGSVFKVYTNTRQDTGVEFRLPADLSPGTFVDARVSQPLQSGTYFLYGRGIMTTAFEC
jgi:hypothetical protein